MAKMILKRLPTTEELDNCGGVEAHSFLDAFSENAIEGKFSAAVSIDEYGSTVLGEWSLLPADWYVVEDEE